MIDKRLSWPSRFLLAIAIPLFLLVSPSELIEAAQRGTSSKNLSDVVAAASGAVVVIQTFDADNNPVAQGSGFIVREDGIVITNLHVAEKAESAIVKLSSGAFFPVEDVLGKREDWDLLAIVVKGRGLPVLPLGNSGVLRVGERVVAIGSPGGLENTVSEGIISAFREVEGNSYRILQTTAPVSPGSSGGPLLDANGRVVGVMTFIADGQNLNFAMPVEIVADLLENPAPPGSSVEDVGKDEDTAPYNYLAGVLSRDAGDYQAAEKFFKEAVRINPSYADAWGSLADIYYRRSDFDQEVTVRQKVVELSPDDSRARLALGVALESAGKEKDAILEYKKALNLNPLSIDASYNLAFLYILNRQFRDADLELERLKKLNPRWADQLKRLLSMLKR